MSQRERMMRSFVVAAGFMAAVWAGGCSRSPAPSASGPPAPGVAISCTSDGDASAQPSAAAASAVSLSSSHGRRVRGMEASEPPSLASDTAPLYQPESPAAAVNVFGEFDGRRPFNTSSEDAGMQQHTVCEEGYDADVAVDPTGKWLAFSSTRHSEHPDIYLQRVDGTSVIQLTNDPASDVQPCFSPDGKRIAFASTRSGNWDLYVMDVDGRNVEQVTNTPAQEMHPSFSPDGNRLAYCSLSPRSEQWELWVIDLTSRQRQTIGQGLFPRWSPQKDMDRIAFQRARQRGSRWFSVWTIDLVNGEPTRPTEVAVSANAAVVSPAWSPDGKRLAFTTIMEPDNSAGGTATARHDVWTCAADGAARQRLTHGDAMNLSPVWSTDNRIYFISDRSGHENVWSIRAGDAPASVAGAAETARAPQKEQKPAAKAPAPPATTAIGAADVREAGH